MNAVESPRRSWLTHERTVLLVVALVVAFGLGWLGRQAQIVRHRRAMREQIEASGGMIPGGGQLGLYQHISGERAVEIRHADSDYRISKLRKLLGDEPLVRIYYLFQELTPADREAIEAFPEAAVVVVQDGPQLYVERPAPSATHQAPSTKRWFGGVPVIMIVFQRQLAADEHKAIETFPEAVVFGIPDAPAAPSAP